MKIIKTLIVGKLKISELGQFQGYQKKIAKEIINMNGLNILSISKKLKIPYMNTYCGIKRLECLGCVKLSKCSNRVGMPIIVNCIDGVENKIKDAC